MPCCCYLFNKSIRSESNWNHPFILHISVYWVPIYRKTAAPPQSPPAIGNLCLNPFTSYGALLLEETDTLTPLQAQWTCISWISWDGICAFTRFKSFQVNLMCCQVRGAQKACLGFLFLNFSIFSIIIAFKVGALLIEREKIVWRKFFSKIEEIRYDIDAEEIIPRPSSVPNRESVLSFLVAHLDWASHRGWIWASYTEYYLFFA